MNIFKMMNKFILEINSNALLDMVFNINAINE